MFRENCTFLCIGIKADCHYLHRLANFLFTKEALERQATILKILQNDPVFDKSKNYFDGRVDKFKTALARAKRLRQLEVEHKWEREELVTATDLISEPGPYGLHMSMYLVRIVPKCYCESCLTIPDHSSRPRHTRTTQTFPRARRELQSNWMLCTNRIGSWVERAWSGNNRHLESRRQDFHLTLSALDFFEMVDWISWKNRKPCRGHGTTYH